MYVYSLYDPPAGHILRDASISTLASEDDPSGPARWSVAVGGVGTYAGGVIHYLGESWGKRTTVFLYKWPSIEPTRQLIIKDYYRLVARRYDEAELLSHIHSQGIVPGVVRLVGTGHVLDAEGKRMMSGTGYDVRERRRLVIADVGEDLLQAKSVNDLLMAIYDVLEVHRTIAQRRNVLHRDMSIYNILLYPKWGQCDRTEFIEDRPPLIKDILGGEMRGVDEYQACCLLTDFDNAARLDDKTKPSELACRTGTPMYIARSVAAGHVWLSAVALSSKPMPTLLPEARVLYDKLHGPNRYKLYEDTPNATIHGGIPLPRGLDPVEMEPPSRSEFYHKLEYDAESVFWSLASALLRVQPQDESDNPTASAC
ncbi:hypothetical protein C8Q76DRAFT_764007 [Earliella scabrosa]|nr:hypothetical protein C8Q76DRAFT_764007 [Earliella scabrosa]